VTDDNKRCTKKIHSFEQDEEADTDEGSEFSDALDYSIKMFEPLAK
jgi:hypothetical protein